MSKRILITVEEEKKKSNGQSIKICIVVHRFYHVYKTNEALQAEFIVTVAKDQYENIHNT